MPARWTLTLRAERPSVERAVTPAQLHGLTATLLEGAGADHHAQHKPYSVSPLLAADRTGRAILRLGWLQDSPRPDLVALTGLRVRLGAQFFTVAGAEEEFTPYPVLCQVPGARRVVMRFVSATYFSRNGRWHPLPDPALLYGGLIRRWNLFAPPYAQIDEAQEKALLSSVALSAHDIASCPISLGAGYRIGFTGDAAFALVGSYAEAVAGLFAGLSLFAAVSGVGAQTTHGLGCLNVGLE
ncbi:CRISPR system precrRNA processing endoribonuclease RAMP protein Cas6 [Streptomyces sp. NPDC002896]|uniref:CRISPR system precrRNA processing endoribonuclease RAMP protein Cas6 n=1 Tax=Streptomyces sp. NPDC002896 TaxID=3154438 RepID=UPI00331B185D